MQANSLKFSSKCKWLIFILILVNATGLFSPVLNSNDAYFYAVLSKNIVENHNWISLIYNGQDWLDKPHFPFWLTALSFKLFGINSFAYVLPGFLFHILGAYYTYRLAKLLYNSEVGLIAALIYVTSLHLLLSAMDVRAEAYLLGEIMPSCFYWLIYDREGSFKSLILASLFTGLAMMTKGIFVVVTIFSGMVFSWIYTREYKRLISGKWLVAYLLCLVWITPELLALYSQFDAHPEKVVFGQTHVSGIAWYFWGSQFGRFFNSGPIVNTHGNPFFFVHTFLWAFLPWSLVFIAATYNILKRFKRQKGSEKAKSVYLLASFGLTFIMFSATKFQLDHYTNIIMPFAAIICANYLAVNLDLRFMTKIQVIISFLILILSSIILIYMFRLSLWSLLSIIPILILISLINRPQISYLDYSLIFPSLAIISAFIMILALNGKAYREYDVGYNIAQMINKEPKRPLYDFDVRSLALEFNLDSPYEIIYNYSQLPDSGQYYLFMRRSDWDNAGLQKNKFHPINEFCGNTIDKVIPHYANKGELVNHLECYVVVTNDQSIR